MKRSELKIIVDDLLNAETPEKQAKVINSLYKKIKSEKGYTDTDLCEFAEWCSLNGWFYSSFTKEWGNSGGVKKTTSDLKTQWKLETGRRKL